MRKEYYKLLQENQLVNILVEIPELSYSLKLDILKNLLKNYSSYIINIALQQYKEKYINIKKYNLLFLKNTLKYLCNKIIKEEIYNE